MLKPLFRAFATGILIVLAAAPAAAQTDYPRRPITLVVPFAAGGPTDVIARIVSEHMSRTLGQQLIVENIVGAGGTTASARVARAAPTATPSKWATWGRTLPRSRSIPI
jgi:tripartite-type tricarboxylate transporter receptor subunit TctC